jgi:hypothetical protein
MSAFLLNDKPWFLNWGKTCCYLHQIFSWGSQLAGYLLHQLGSIKLFLAPLPRKSGRPLQGEFFRTHILYFVIVLLYFIFTCIILYQKPKKLESLVVVYYV